MYVEVKGSDSAAFQRAMTEFKRLVKKHGIFDDLKRHEYYVKPSLKRKLKRIEARKQLRRDQNARTKDKANRSRGDSQSTQERWTSEGV